MKFKDVDYKAKSKWIFVISIIMMIFGLFILRMQKPGNDPVGIVYKFLDADTIEEKLQYTLNPDKAEEYLSDVDHYKVMQYEFGEDKIDLDKLIYEVDYQVEELEDGDVTRIKVYPDDEYGDEEDRNVIFYLKKVQDEFKIDFEPDYTKNSGEILTLLKEKSGESKIIKLYATVDKYNGSTMYDTFKEDNPYVLSDSYSISLYDDTSGYYGQAFIKRGTKESEYLYEYLKGGLKQVTLDIKYNKYENEYFDTFIIEDVVSFTWAEEDSSFEFRDF